MILPGGSRRRDADLIDEGGVVAAGAVQALEGDRVRPGGDRERGGAVALVRRARRRDGPAPGAGDQDREVLPRRLEVGPLRRVEADRVAAGGPAGDGLADRAVALEEGDLGPLGGARVARGEAAAVGRDAAAVARGTGEGPGGAGRVVDVR